MVIAIEGSFIITANIVELWHMSMGQISSLGNIGTAESEKKTCSKCSGHETLTLVLSVSNVDSTCCDVSLQMLLALPDPERRDSGTIGCTKKSI